jgi:CRISPR-associated endonuclease/helicase Cas3
VEDANGALWAKFPDVRQIIEVMPLSDEDRGQLLGRVRASFRPNLRHEAASALAAWRAWRDGQPPLTALAVYLIAAHHGKVRTVLRALKTSDEAFGLKREDRLQPVAPRFVAGADLSFTPKVVGSRGQWSDDGKCFTPAEPCWSAAIAELLGPSPGCGSTRTAIGEVEPAEIGPFTLAYLEALLRAADVRASERPGQGVQS